MIKINNKEYTKEEAKELLLDENSVVTSAQIEVSNHSKLPGEPTTNEGFAIEKQMISSMCDAMDIHGASQIKLAFKNCGTVKGRNVYIIMADPDDEINEILEGK